MKKYIFLIMGVLIALGSYGQSNNKFGFRVGGNICTVDPVVGEVIYPNNAGGIQVGITYEHNLFSTYYFRTAAIFSEKGFKSANANQAVYNGIFVSRFRYIDVPLTLAYKVNMLDDSYFFMEGGFYGSVLVQGEVDYKAYHPTSPQDGNGQLKPFDIGFKVGGGMQFGLFQFAVSYSKGMMDVNDNNFLYTNDVNFRNQVIGISGTYLFGRR